MENFESSLVLGGDKFWSSRMRKVWSLIFVSGVFQDIPDHGVMKTLTERRLREEMSEVGTIGGTTRNLYSSYGDRIV